MDIKKTLIEGIIQDLIIYLCEDRNMDINAAMELVYNSITYTKLCNEDTGLYIESSAYVYELLKDEMAEGCLRQREI